MSGVGMVRDLSLASRMCKATRVNKKSKKVRKQYTRTKVREAWTETEHVRFLEALHLFDRDWKSVTEHVASKNIVQVRSHAQKFFLKLRKTDAGTDTGTDTGADAATFTASSHHRESFPELDTPPQRPASPARAAGPVLQQEQQQKEQPPLREQEQESPPLSPAVSCSTSQRLPDPLERGTRPPTLSLAGRVSSTEEFVMAGQEPSHSECSGSWTALFSQPQQGSSSEESEEVQGAAQATPYGPLQYHDFVTSNCQVEEDIWGLFRCADGDAPSTFPIASSGDTEESDMALSRLQSVADFCADDSFAFEDSSPYPLLVGFASAESAQAQPWGSSRKFAENVSFLSADLRENTDLLLPPDDIWNATV